MRLLGLAATVASLGCIGPRVEVLPSGPGARAMPRPPGCKMEFFRTRPERPFDELAALLASGGDTGKREAADFHEALRAKGCELGADAIIVTTDYLGYLGPGRIMNGVAIKYRSTPASVP